MPARQCWRRFLQARRVDKRKQIGRFEIGVRVQSTMARACHPGQDETETGLQPSRQEAVGRGSVAHDYLDFTDPLAHQANGRRVGLARHYRLGLASARHGSKK
jgi:hypothetical protein